MTNKLPLTLAAPAQHLRHLVMIRWLLVICLGATATVTFIFSEVELPYQAFVTILVFFITINWLTALRLRHEMPVTDIEFFIQLLLDVLCLSALFYFSGGANNPFISYFLVPICISAATLSWSYTWVITLLCIASYTLLLFFHIALPALSPVHHHGNHQDINLHIIGMWLNFFISAALITYFVVKMAQDLRLQDEQLNQQREDDLRDEQLMAVATLAAGTAHELGTPLSTMKVLLAELRDEYRNTPQLYEDLNILSDQVQQCAHTLQNLIGKAEYGKDGQLEAQSLRQFCMDIIDRWLVMRPEAIAEVHLDPNVQDVICYLHPTIGQSIINLLNNAADAAPENIIIRIEWEQTSMHWQIEDNGPGIPMEIASQLGKPFVTTKGKGLGLGLFLTHATINRYGGKVYLYNRAPHGTLTELRLPLQFKES